MISYLPNPGEKVRVVEHHPLQSADDGVAIGVIIEAYVSMYVDYDGNMTLNPSRFIQIRDTETSPFDATWCRVEPVEVA